MLKVIVYAYTQKIYSSRKIEKALWENIGFMWISGATAGLSHDQQLSERHVEGSGAESVRFDDGASGGRGLREDGELLCGWEQAGRQLQPAQSGVGEEDAEIQGETTTANSGVAG
ncbi:MAG: transposase [Anaerolineae bacterium]|nr:transposase [Anaerolineae bacterium]